ncbi:MAG: hypothetical protein ABIQ64_00955 [Candidatus Saccharimonadales bacterium]
MSEHTGIDPARTGGTDERSPHSGNLEGDMREIPAIEYTTPLDQAVEQGLIPRTAEEIHDLPADNFAEHPLSEEEIAIIQDRRAGYGSDKPNRMSGRKLGVIGTVGALVATGTLAFILRGSGDQKEESTTPALRPTTSEPLLPTPSEAPTDPSILVPSNPVVEADKKRTMSGEEAIKLEAEEFAELPRETRMRGQLYILQHSQDKSTIEFAILDDKGQYKADILAYNPYEIAALDNTPKQIVGENLYTEAAALGARVEQGKSSSPMDKRLAEITLGAAYYFTLTDKKVTQSYELRHKEITDVNNTEALHIANRVEVVEDSDPLTTCPVSVSGETVLPCRDIQTKIIAKNKTESAPYWTRYVYVTDKDSGKGLWQIFGRDANKRSLDKIRIEQ